ncbi:hypothetical protein [Sporomusa malonica]|uniref:Uncharacterized protein n=1 Tax=Sporomusa malonica TaxID=112901 RepID=A0A1W2DA91_9FIRM|nr:hypothetical protein [Sporomusa malonica]SMC93918.1 hypothetical protein SAMN04488500_11449 [Sporomusa malonica]
MDILIPLLLMLVMYLVPELLKRRKQPKEYEYPDIPEKVPQPIDIKPAEIKVKHTPQQTAEVAVEAPKTWAIPPKPAISMPTAVTVSHFSEPATPWEGKVSPQMVQNGLIFAEIIQPPRAYRPIWRHLK